MIPRSDALEIYTHMTVENGVEEELHVHLEEALANSAADYW